VYYKAGKSSKKMAEMARAGTDTGTDATVPLSVEIAPRSAFLPHLTFNAWAVGTAAGEGAVGGGLGGKGREAIVAKYSKLGKKARELVSAELLTPPQRQGYLEKLSGGKAGEGIGSPTKSPLKPSEVGLTVGPGQKWQVR
jgi:hypothetical protein